VPHREQQTERALARAHASAQQVDPGHRGGAATGEEIAGAEAVEAEATANPEAAVEAAVVDPSVEAAATEEQSGGTEEQSGGTEEGGA